MKTAQLMSKEASTRAPDDTLAGMRRLRRAAAVVVLAVSTLGPAARAAELAGATLPDTLSAGDETLKCKGTALRLGDHDLGAFAGKGFADAVFSIWLGAKPPTEGLKKGMLGG